MVGNSIFPIFMGVFFVDPPPRSIAVMCTVRVPQYTHEYDKGLVPSVSSTFWKAVSTDASR